MIDAVKLHARVLRSGPYESSVKSWQKAPAMLWATRRIEPFF